MKNILLLISILSFHFLYSQSLFTEVVTANQMTSASSLVPTMNYGNSTDNWVGVSDQSFTGKFVHRVFIQFDLSNIPSNAIIVEAKINIAIKSPPLNVLTLQYDRITEAWDQYNLNWANQPSSKQIPTTISPNVMPNISGGNILIDVKNDVQKMTSGVVDNHGWLLRAIDEITSNNNSVTLHSNTPLNIKPYLSIKYILPPNLENAIISHESVINAQDGQIIPSFINSGGISFMKTYQWYNNVGIMPGKTNLQIDNLPYGWYGLEVSIIDNGLPYKFYFSFLVGLQCEDVMIDYNPGPNFISDALLSSFAANYELNLGAFTTFRAEKWTSGTWFETASLLKYHLFIDQYLSLESADMLLYGNGHNPMNRPNNSEFLLVNEYWNEDFVAYSSNVGRSNIISLDVPATPSGNQNLTLEMLPFFKYWQENPALNHGIYYKLKILTDSYTRQQFHSSDYNVSALRPKVTFIVSAQTPRCMSYAELKVKNDGSFVYAYDGLLKFTLDNEYETDTGEYLKYKIFNDSHELIQSSDEFGNRLHPTSAALPFDFDDNRFELNLKLVNGVVLHRFYLLEVENAKGDKRYLRFFNKL